MPYRATQDRRVMVESLGKTWSTGKRNSKQLRIFPLRTPWIVWKGKKMNFPDRFSSVQFISVAQSSPTLCDPMDCSLPGFSVHGISQARILEWVTISFSRGFSWPRDWTPALVHCRQILYHLSHHGSPLLAYIPTKFKPSVRKLGDKLRFVSNLTWYISWINDRQRITTQTYTIYVRQAGAQLNQSKASESYQWPGLALPLGVHARAATGVPYKINPMGCPSHLLHDTFSQKL